MAKESREAIFVAPTSPRSSKSKPWCRRRRPFRPLDVISTTPACTYGQTPDPTRLCGICDRRRPPFCFTAVAPPFRSSASACGQRQYGLDLVLLSATMAWRPTMRRKALCQYTLTLSIDHGGETSAPMRYSRRSIALPATDRAHPGIIEEYKRNIPMGPRRQAGRSPAAVRLPASDDASYFTSPCSRSTGLTAATVQPNFTRFSGNS